MARPQLDQLSAALLPAVKYAPCGPQTHWCERLAPKCCGESLAREQEINTRRDSPLHAADPAFMSLARRFGVTFGRLCDEAVPF
jgi:hypothetical protein